MSWKFNPPPGWPAQPEGWVPPPGWIPDPSWPPAPPGWQFWVPAGSGQPGGTPTPTPTPAAPPPAQAGPASPFSAGSPAFPASAPGAQSFSAAPTPTPSPFGPAPGFGGAPPPYGAAPAGGPATGKPWFSTWWAIVGLIVLLLLGSAAGYGGTRLALASSDETDPAAATAPSPEPAGTPAPPATPGLALPTVPPVETPGGGEFGEVCSEVAVILVTLALAPVEAAEGDDYDAFVEVVVDSRRTAAGQIRDLEGEDAAQQDSLDTLADEIDGAAQMVEDDPDDQATVDESFDRVGNAYDDFNDQHC